MQFLFGQFYLGSAKLNAQAVNPNADEVRILDKPEWNVFLKTSNKLLFLALFQTAFQPLYSISPIN